jgi:two-component system chemotaxis response regulator CheY
MAKKILIVDDSTTTRAVIKRTLRMAGFSDVQVFEASDGQAALDILASCHVDLVLADLNMPRMNGVEMIKRMDADAALIGIPVVVVSAEPNAPMLASLSSAAVRGHIRKPFTPEEIREVVTELLEVTRAS